MIFSKEIIIINMFGDHLLDLYSIDLEKMIKEQMN